MRFAKYQRTGTERRENRDVPLPKAHVEAHE
jgi:hypothetical protein